MWPFSQTERVNSYLERGDVLDAARNWSSSNRSFARFLSRFSADDAERVIEAYALQEDGLVHDPLEDSPELQSVFREVDRIVDERLPSHEMGMCYPKWDLRKALLRERGVSWLSPSELNPHVIFD